MLLNCFLSGSLMRRSLRNGVLSRETKEDLRKVERGFWQIQVLTRSPVSLFEEESAIAVSDMGARVM